MGRHLRGCQLAHWMSNVGTYDGIWIHEQVEASLVHARQQRPLLADRQGLMRIMQRVHYRGTQMV